MEGSLSQLVEKVFHNSEALIFIGAVGIAVRLIAPFIRAKDKDPAVIVIDEKGSYVIPILSGHLGGANQIAYELADVLKGQAVITTATDVNRVFSVDVWAKEQELHIHNMEAIKYISAALLKGEKIGFVCDYEIDGELPEFITATHTATGTTGLNIGTKAGIYISEDIANNLFEHTLQLTPKNYVLGIGCRRNVEVEILEKTVLNYMGALNLSPDLFSTVATIDIKEKEPAILAFCNKFRLSLSIYSSAALNKAAGEFTASDFVKNTVGVDNVCERAAFLASKEGEIVLRKTFSQGVTVAIAKKKWRCRF